MRRSAARRPTVLMATGVMTTNALRAADLLAQAGHDVSVVHFHTIKPLDTDAILSHARNAKLVVTLEEGIAIGGFGSAVTDLIVDAIGPGMPHMKRIALPDSFPSNYGVQNDLFEIYGLLPPQIARTIAEIIGRIEPAA
jgi:transketolase